MCAPSSPSVDAAHILSAIYQVLRTRPDCIDRVCAEALQSDFGLGLLESPAGNLDFEIPGSAIASWEIQLAAEVAKFGQSFLLDSLERVAQRQAEVLDDFDGVTYRPNRHCSIGVHVDEVEQQQHLTIIVVEIFD